MFLQAVREAKLDKIFSWFLDRDEGFDFAKQHNGERIDYCFVLYPNFWICRKLRKLYPLIGFKYKAKIRTGLFLKVCMKFDNSIPEVVNNARLLKKWISSCRVGAI